jgi:3-hydroxyacyl-CoA dehydrogenase/3a,7a,12a-trihydroxy-5b-cholest-24-enoyl-CoA hydratase
MPIDPAVVGKEIMPMEFPYTQKDVILYAIGIGAGTEPGELKLVYENGLEVLPTFGVVPAYAATMNMVSTKGLDINYAMLLHGEQYLEVRRHPLPVHGRLTSRPVISNLFDKVKGALLEVEMDSVDESGEVVFFNRFGFFIRGEGGFGGERGSEPGNEPPVRGPDKMVEMRTIPQQAMIYRLSGNDINPLHIDPGFAALAGFEKPILQGMCTFGFMGRAVLREYCDSDPERFRAIKVRFRGHVFPGETIVAEMWRESEEKVIIRARTAERGDFCLTNSAVWLNA